MTISQIEPHHQNDRNHYEGPIGSKEKYANFVLPEDLKALGGNAAASDVYADDFLYDMRVDPHQLNNVVADPAYAEIKADMRKRLRKWLEKAEGAHPTIID